MWGCNCDKIKSHTHWEGDPQMGKISYLRGSPTRVKVMSTTSGCPAWWSGGGAPKAFGFEGRGV